METSNWSQQNASPTAVASVLIGLASMGLTIAFLDTSKSTDAATVIPKYFHVGDLCRAAISKIMAQPVNIIRIDDMDTTYAEVSYHRPDDGKLWEQKCRLSGNRIIWAARDGRWRTNTEWDELITFSTSDDGERLFVREQYFDGSGSTAEYARADFSF